MDRPMVVGVVIYDPSAPFYPYLYVDHHPPCAVIHARVSVVVVQKFVVGLAVVVQEIEKVRRMGLKKQTGRVHSQKSEEEPVV